MNQNLNPHIRSKNVIHKRENWIHGLSLQLNIASWKLQSSLYLSTHEIKISAQLHKHQFAIFLTRVNDLEHDKK